jgi:hypothetical protein
MIREEHRLTVFKNRMLRRIFGPHRRLCNEDRMAVFGVLHHVVGRYSLTFEDVYFLHDCPELWNSFHTLRG